MHKTFYSLSRAPWGRCYGIFQTTKLNTGANFYSLCIRAPNSQATFLTKKLNVPSIALGVTFDYKSWGGGYL